jgi:uncharacterized membrane protein
MMKRIITAVVLCSLIGISTAAQLVWDITPLDPTIFPGGHTESMGWSINNNKQIIGEVWAVINNVQTEHYPAVWDFSDPKGWGVSHTMDIDIESMYLKWPYFHEINDNGQVCGQYTYAYPGIDPTFRDRGMVYDIYNRTARDLGALGDDKDAFPLMDDYDEPYLSFASGINNAGTVVGWSQTGFTNVWGRRETGDMRPTSWIGGGKPTEVGDSAYWFRKINNNNLMIAVDMLDDMVGPERAFKQFGRTCTLLPMPPGRDTWASSAQDLNDLDMIVGYIWGPDTSEGILWHPTAGIVRLPSYPGYDWANPYAINKHGMIVGASNGAVVWMGTGSNYQVVSMDMFAAQHGWNLLIAYDINDDGWIVGRGVFNGHDMGFLARPRLDENPPIANLDSDTITNEGGEVTIGVLYYDDNGMNTATMDNKDIQVIYPDGTKVAAEFKSVKELDPEPETGKRKYQALYSFSTPPMNPMSPEGAIIRILVAESEVSDLSGRYVPKGPIGELELSFPAMTASILKGSTFDTKTVTTTWKFQTDVYTGPVNPLVQVLGVQFQPPGSSSWWTMTSSGDGIWKYVQSASNAVALNAFGNGDYTYRITLDFGGPFEMEKVFRYGMDSNGLIIPAPVVNPMITSPQQGPKISHKNISFNWAKPTDPAITSMICSIVDVATGNEVFNKIITNGTATTAGATTLLPDRNYVMTVYFCSGLQNNPEEDDWASYTLKYTATKLAFATLPYAGDINDDGVVDLNDLSLLSQCWKKTSGQAGWNAQCDLQPNGTIDLGDLLVVAQHWLQ